MKNFRPDKMMTIAACLLLFTVAGCAAVGQRMEPPQVKLANLQLEQFSLLETVFEVHLRIFNTNDTALQIKGLQCELQINGQPFAMGVSDAEVEIPSYGTQLVPLRAYASLFDILKSAQGMKNQDQLKYHLKGKVRLGAGAFPSVLAFDSEGNISLPEIPELKKDTHFSKPF
jgi:LEA14-like dessication related protein